MKSLSKTGGDAGIRTLSAGDIRGTEGYILQMAPSSDDPSLPRGSPQSSTQLSTRRRRPSEVVYFIRADESGLIKIGRARDVRKRFSALQTGSAERLTLLGVIRDRDAEWLERWLHSEFAHARVRGEWFSMCSGLQHVITEHALTPEEDDQIRIEEMVAQVVPGASARLRPGGHRAALAAYKAERGLT